MKRHPITSLFLFVILFSLFPQLTSAQDYLNYQLRLEPVWSRVADALGEYGSVESAEFSVDGKYIVSGTKYDNSVIVWRTSDGAELWRAYTEQEIERAGWSHDGKYVAAVSEDFKVTVYEAMTGKVHVVYELEHALDGLIWANNSNLLVVGEEHTKRGDRYTGGAIRVYDMDTGKEVQVIDYGRTVNELFFTSDDTHILAAGHGGVRVYETNGWTMVQDLQIEGNKHFTSAAFSPDDTYIIGASNQGFPRGNIYIWDWKEGKQVKEFNQFGKKIESVTWHPNGRYIAYAGHSPYIYVYRVEEMMKYKNDDIPVAHKVWAGDHAEYIDFNTDGSFLVSAHQNGLIKLWVWMGEEPDLNSNLHNKIKTTQRDSK